MTDGTLIVNGGKLVSLKAKFLKYVEYQRAAEELRFIEKGVTNKVGEAFTRANVCKQELMEMIDRYEAENV